jgi:ATP-dependent Zn protease
MTYPQDTTEHTTHSHTVQRSTMSNLLAVFLMLASAVLVQAIPISPTTLATTACATTTLTPLPTTSSHINNLDEETRQTGKSMKDLKDGKNILNSAIQRPPHYDSDQWALLAARILASIAVLTAIFIIIFFLHRRRIRGRRRRIGEMMGLGNKRNEILLHKASKHYRAASGTSGNSTKSHPREHAHRWRFSVAGGRQQRDDEESRVARGVAVDGRGGTR